MLPQLFLLMILWSILLLLVITLFPIMERNFVILSSILRSLEVASSRAAAFTMNSLFDCLPQWYLSIYEGKTILLVLTIPPHVKSYFWMKLLWVKTATQSTYVLSSVS